MSDTKLKFYDTENVSDLLLKDMVLKNIEISKNMKKEIINLKKFTLECSNENNTSLIDNYVHDDDFLIDESADVEDTLSFYCDPIMDINDFNLSDDELDDEIAGYLPIFYKDNINPMIYRIKLEILKEINEFQAIINGENDKDLLNEIKTEIEFNKRKLMSIDRLLSKDDDINENLFKRNNKLIFLTTNAGNYSVLKDLKDIPLDYYDSFVELFDSIINGTFKNLKPFKNINRSISGVSEVKNFKTRILFDRINKDTFIILTIFMKDFDLNRFYLESLAEIISNYRRDKDYYKNKAEDSDFMLEQENIKEQVYDILNQKVLVKSRGEENE